MTGIYTAESLVQGGPDLFVGYLERLDAVTAADVSRVLDHRLIGSPCLAVLIEPEAAEATAASAAQAAQGGKPAGMPGGMPGRMPGAMPGAMPGGHPGADGAPAQGGRR